MARITARPKHSVHCRGEAKTSSNSLGCELRRVQVLYDRNYDNYDECTLRYRNYDTVKAVGALYGLRPYVPRTY